MPQPQPGSPGEETRPTARVAAQLACAECEYNLIGQPEAGRCPECGYSVDESIRSGGFWTITRIASLRLGAILFAVSVPPWVVGTLLTRVAAPTTFLRILVATLLVAHFIALLASWYAGLRASSRLPASSRRAVGIGAAVVVTVVTAVPLLLITGFFVQATIPMTVTLVASNVVRLLLAAMCIWWIAAGTASLRPLWNGSLWLLRISMALLLLGWCLFGITLLVRAATGQSSGGPLEGTANLALACEAIATGFAAGLGIALAVSLRRQPRRLSYSSET